MAAGAVPAIVASLQAHLSVVAVAQAACGALEFIAIFFAGREACVASGAAVPALVAALKAHPCTVTLATVCLGMQT